MDAVTADEKVALPHPHECCPEEGAAFTWPDGARIAVVGAGAVLSGLIGWRPLPAFDLVAVVATLLGGYPVFREAFQSLLRGRVTMELSMALAFAAALAVDEGTTAVIIVLFVLVAEALERATISRGRRAIRDVLDYLPETALRRKGLLVEEIRLVDVRPGDRLLIRPGARLPVDGQVLEGRSFVVEAMITGEAAPVARTAGDRVFAGTLNQNGALEVEASAVGRDTAFGRIVAAVEESERNRSGAQRFADRLAGWLVVVALSGAALTWIATRDIRSTIAVVIVAGACGVAAGTPLAILGTLGRAARRGVIVKGGAALEALWSADTVVLDKTGTLTFGEPRVAALSPAPGISPRMLLRTAACAEGPSEHPLARAIRVRAQEEGLPLNAPKAFDALPGLGVTAQDELGIEVLVGTRSLLQSKGVSSPEEPTGDVTWVYVAGDGVFLGLIAIADLPREGAAEAVARLRRMKFRTELLTGDSQESAEGVARALGVDAFEARLLPEEKRERVRRHRERERRVIMVGDGLNDVPAMAEATAGVAMGTGTDLAREAAQVVLVGNDLGRFADTLADARRCRRILWFNLWATIAVDIAGMALAGLGWLEPVAAGAVHVGSEILFLLNAARMLPR